MKKKLILTVIIMILVIASSIYGFNIYAASKLPSDDVIPDGVTINGIDVSGMDQESAESAVNEYIETLKEETITLMAEENPVEVSVSDLGMTWSNTDVVEDALGIGKTGNIIQRYKAIKDLENEPQEFSLTLDFDKDAITSIINEQCTVFDVEAQNATIERVNGTFEVTEGQTGLGISVEESVEAVYQYLTEEWDYSPTSIDLVVETTEAEITTEALDQINDELGSFTTSFTTSSSARSKNVENGAALINGTVVMPGDTFSTYDNITPFTEDNGYYLAGSYFKGQVVDTVGGGICQVSTTLYNAVLLAEMDVEERHNHSMIVSYVDPSCDAAISESAGKDFKFVNSTDYPIYIEGITQNKTITFNIYGVETRDSNRTVEYESEVLSTTEPSGYNYVIDAAIPFGTQKQTQSAHTGYKAKLWKHVYVDGEEVSVEEVNYSSYKAEPAYISVGTMYGDETSVAALTAAVGTNDSATVTQTINDCAAAVNLANAIIAEQNAVASGDAAAVEAAAAAAAQAEAEAAAAAQAEAEAAAQAEAEAAAAAQAEAEAVAAAQAEAEAAAAAQAEAEAAAAAEAESSAAEAETPEQKDNN